MSSNGAYTMKRVLLHTVYDVQRICKRIKTILCNFQVVFCVGMTLALQIFLSGSNTNTNLRSGTAESGDFIYHWRDNTKIRYTDYAISVLYRLVVQHPVSEVQKCSEKAFDIHDQAGMPIRNLTLMKTLGDTNIHSVYGILDDRDADRKSVRVLGVGLHPGTKLHCLYDCQDSKSRRCSSPVSGVILPAGKAKDYQDYGQRKSLMDTMMFTCPVRENDNPSYVTFTTNKCGYSHNILPLMALQTQNVVEPPWELGVCVRPIDSFHVGNAENLARWIEFWRINGAGNVHIYTSNDKLKKLLTAYQQEKLRLVDVVDWAVPTDQLERPVSDQAAVNHCILSNMMKNRYMIVVSYGTILLSSGKYQNLKQLVRDEQIQHSFNIHSGFRVQDVRQDQAAIGSPTLLLKSRHVLATAAQHFIPLVGRPAFKVLDPQDVAALPLSNIGEHHSGQAIEQFLNKQAKRMIKKAYNNDVKK